MKHNLELAVAEREDSSLVNGIYGLAFIRYDNGEYMAVAGNSPDDAQMQMQKNGRAYKVIGYGHLIIDTDNKQFSATINRLEEIEPHQFGHFEDNPDSIAFTRIIRDCAKSRGYISIAGIRYATKQPSILRTIWNIWRYGSIDKPMGEE